MGSMTKHVGSAEPEPPPATLRGSAHPDEWGLPQMWGDVPTFGTYGVRMSPAKRRAAPDPLLVRRRQDFGAFVARVYDAAKARGMTVLQIEDATGLGSTTIYGWRDGRWTRDPVTTLVNQFCDGLGARRTEAYRALRWSEDGMSARKATEPLFEDSDVRKLMRMLNSPHTPPSEKLLIRRQIRAMTEGFKDTPEEREE